MNAARARPSVAPPQEVASAPVASVGFEDAKANLEALIEWWGAEGHGTRNEATTRLHLIDDLLLRVLGWPKNQIVAEERFEGRFTDYSIGDTATRLIFEAKREGTYFELPAGVGPRTVSLETLAEGSEDIDAAIRQALAYCLERGVPIGAVSNGHQLLAFLASRKDGVPPLQGKALAFDSLQAMRDEFQLLWDNLSPAGVELQTIERTLGASTVATPPEKLSTRINGYPGYWTRNKISTE